MGQGYVQQRNAGRGLLRRCMEKIMGAEPGAGDAADRSLHGQSAGAGDGLSSTALLATLPFAPFMLILQLEKTNDTDLVPAICFGVR